MASIDPTRRDPVTGKPRVTRAGRPATATRTTGSARRRSTAKSTPSDFSPRWSPTHIGAWVDPEHGRITLAAWTKDYLATTIDLRPTTRETGERDLTRFVLPRFGSTPISRTTAVEVRTWLADELAAGIAPSSAHRHYRTLRRVLQVAVESDLMAKNPCAAVKPPRIPPTEMRFLTADDVTALADTHSDW